MGSNPVGGSGLTAPLVQWLECMVPNHTTRVRFPDGADTRESQDRVAQLDSALDFESNGCGFESRHG